MIYTVIPDKKAIPYDIFKTSYMRDTHLAEFHVGTRIVMY